MSHYINKLLRCILSIILACSISIHSLEAQGYIDEDFLEKLDANARFLLNESAPEFANTSIPAKWDKESAVILGFSRSILFDKQSSGGFFSRKERSLYFIEKIRLKVKVQDNSSVQAFSEIYFRYGMKEDGFIARIIKSNGTTVDVDLKAAVGVEDGSDIPEYFQSFFDQVARSNYQYYKVPVADLEPGDILEYVTTTKSKLDVKSSGYIEFSPIYEICSKNYPVAYNSIAIETDDKSFFKSLSLNGAPSFARENSADKGFFRYVFTDRNRDPEKDVNFVNPYVQYPLVKFQVIYSNSDQVKGALIGEKGELKSSFSQEELARKAWEEYETVGSLYFEGITVQAFVKQCWNELVKLGAKDLTDQQYIDKAYYLLRNKILFLREYISDKKFAYIFGSLLYQKDIKSDLLITTSNTLGSLSQVLFDQEIRYVIKVGDRLYFNCTDFSNPGELVESLVGNEAYIIYAPAKKTGKQEIKPYNLPGTSPTDNLSEFQINSEISGDMKTLLVARTSTYKGIQKSRSISDALRFTTYMLDDYKNYGGDDPAWTLKGKQADDYHSSVRVLKEEFKKQKPDFVKQGLQSEYQQRVNNVHFTLLTDGRTLKKNVLSFKEGFELNDFVRKAGRKYLVNLPGLMGSQLQIKKEEKERKHDIDVRYPRTLKWTINFKIPAGYSVEGLQELNTTVDNQAGTFTSVAKEENGSVRIDMVKTYKARIIPKEKWNEMVAFVDAAYNNTFRYILLKPVK